MSLIVSSALAAGNPLTASNPSIQAEPQETVQTVVQVDPLDEWIERLVQEESRGREDIVIVDVNGKNSYSCLQFQEGTFVSYSKRYGIEGNIMDCAFQKKLAKLMIQESRKNANHWYTSVFKKGVGLPPTL